MTTAIERFLFKKLTSQSNGYAINFIVRIIYNLLIVNKWNNIKVVEMI